MKFLNLTPHPLTIVNDKGPVLDLPVHGPAPRLTPSREPLGNVLTSSSIPVPVVRTTLGDPVGLPEPVEGTILIVSALVAEHPSLAHREDLAAPGEAVRDESGKVVAAKGLAVGPGLAAKLRANMPPNPHKLPEGTSLPTD